MEQKIIQLIACILAILSFPLGMGTYEILNLPKDARSLSLHNSASAYDGSFLRNNPASLSLAAEKTEFSYLVFPASIHSGEIQQIRKIGSRLQATKLSYISYGTITDSESHEKTTAYEILCEMGYKQELKNFVSVGISGGYLFSSIAGYHSQLLYANIGIRSRTMRKRIGLGFSLENVGFILSSYTDVKESIPTIFRSAMYYKPIYLPAVISIDIIRNLDIDAVEYSGSLEVNPGKWLSLRLGCSSNRADFLTSDFSSNLLADVSGGIGFVFNKMNLDIGFMNFSSAGYVVGFSISRNVD